MMVPARVGVAQAVAVVEAHSESGVSKDAEERSAAASCDAPSIPPPAKEAGPRLPDGNQVRDLLDCLDLHDRLDAYERALRSSKRNINAEPPAQVRRALTVYTLGFTALGLALGMLAGWSASPVVATLLPILFGVIGATGGFALTRSNLSADRVLGLGLAIALFSTASVFGALLGVSMRTGRSVLSLLPSLETSEPDGLIQLWPADVMVLLELQEKLGASSISRRTQRALLNQVVAVLQRDRKEPLQTVHSELDATIAVLRKDAELATVLKDSVATLSVYQAEVQSWLRLESDPTPTKYYSERLEEIGRVVKNDAIVSSALDRPERAVVLEAMWRLHSSVLRAQSRLSSEQIDTIKATLAQASAGKHVASGATRGPASEE